MHALAEVRVGRKPRAATMTAKALTILVFGRNGRRLMRSGEVDDEFDGNV